jgi:hypothetical protein
MLNNPTSVLTPISAGVQAIYAGFPSEDVGQISSYEGLNIVKVSNGSALRYLLANDTLHGRTLVTSWNDSTTNGAWLWDILVPGGLLTGQDRITLDFAFLMPIAAGTSTSVRIGLFAEGPPNPEQYGTASPGTWLVSLSSGATGMQYMTVNLDCDGSNTLTLTSSTPTFAAYTNPANKRANLQRDFHLKVGIAFSGTVTGRTAVPKYCRASIRSNGVQVDPTLTYRSPYKQPFNSRSIWNTPLNTGATYSGSGADVTALIQNPNPGGVTGGSYRWVNGAGTDGTPIIYQISNNDPICNFTYSSRAFGGPWPFPATPSSNGSFQARCKPFALYTAQTTDKVVFILMPDGRFMLEGGSYSYNAATNTHSFGYLTVVELAGYGVTWDQVYPNVDSTQPLMAEYYRAGGVPLSGGMVYGSELAAGLINHAVCCQLSPYLARAAVFNVVSATGTTFVINAIFNGTVTQTYASLFPSGTTIYHNGTAYTTTGTPTYNSSNGQTTITVTATITTTATQLFLGGTSSTPQRQTQFVWPASANDSGSLQTTNVLACYQGLVPMGALLAIPQSVSLSTLGIQTNEGMALATAFQQFGGYFMDTAQNTFALCHVYSDVTAQQMSNLFTDLNAIRGALQLVTNNTQLIPGGTGTPLTTVNPLLTI